MRTVLLYYYEYSRSSKELVHEDWSIYIVLEEGYSRSGKELVHEDAQRPEVDRSVMALHEDTTRQYSDDKEEYHYCWQQGGR